MSFDKGVITTATDLFVDSHSFDHEAAEKRLHACLMLRSLDVRTLTGVDKLGKKQWHCILVNVNKEKLYEMKHKCLTRKWDTLDLDYDEILLSGFDEKPPSTLIGKIENARERLTDLHLIREHDNSWHYVLIDEDKRLMFANQFKTDSVEEIKNCATVLYSAWGQDPPDSISSTIIGTYLKDGESAELCNKHCYLLHDLARHGKVKETRQLIDKGFDINDADKNGWTPLHHAAFSGKVEIVKLLTDKGANVHAKDKTCGREPIHIAAREGNESIIKFFLDKDVNVNRADRHGWLALHYAAWSGNLGAVKLLVERGSDINARDLVIGKKSIHIAAANGHTRVIDYFLKCGMNIDDVDIEKSTPLYYAALYGQLAAVDFLIHAGADLHAKNIRGSGFVQAAASADNAFIADRFLSEGLSVDERDNKSNTPLLVSVFRCNLEVTKFLVQKGANIFLRNSHGKTPLDCAKEEGRSKIFNFLKYAYTKSSPSLHIAAMKNDLKAVNFFANQDANVNAIDMKKYTPLHYAVEYGSLNVVNFLLSKGASVFTRCSPDTVLHMAVRSNVEEVIRVILNTIRDRQEDITPHVNAEDSKGNTPLIYAAQRGNLNIIQMLLEHGADVHVKNKDGMTALHCAAEKGHYKVVEFLVDKGADIHVEDNDCSEPIHYAATWGNPCVMEFLINQGAHVDSVSNFGTPLHCAAYSGNLKAAEFLTSRDANVHALNIAGMEPLHCVVNGNCNTDVLELLLKKGASVNDTDALGKTPLHYSALERKLELMEFLIKKGATSCKDTYGKTPLDWAREKNYSSVAKLLEPEMIPTP